MDSEGATTTAVLSFLVLPENDPPVLESISATYDTSTRTHDGLSDVVSAVDLLSVREDQNTLVPGLSVRDVDLNLDSGHIFGGDASSTHAGVVEITVYASNGTTSLGSGTIGYAFLLGDGTDDRILAFRANLEGANRALAGLTYRGRTDFYGTDELVVTVDDGGNYGGGTLCAEGGRRTGEPYDYGDDATCSQVMQGAVGQGGLFFVPGGIMS